METSGSVKLLKHVEDKGFQIDIDFNPPCDGTCFYDSAGYQLGLNATIFFFNFEIFQPLTCYPRPSKTPNMYKNKFIDKHGIKAIASDL